MKEKRENTEPDLNTPSKGGKEEKQGSVPQFGRGEERGRLVLTENIMHEAISSVGKKDSILGRKDPFLNAGF